MYIYIYYISKELNPCKPKVTSLTQGIDEPTTKLILLCKNVYMRYKWTYLQNKNRHTDIENKPMVTKGERDKLGLWD